MLEIQFQNIPPSEDLIEILHKTADAVIQQNNYPKKSKISLLITNDEGMKKLNKSFRNIDAPTDVLSFPNPEAESFLVEAVSELFLGDIAISYERAKFQAEQRGHASIAEMQLLCIHGLLHLMGFDHADEFEKQTMWNFQNQILDSLGVEIDQSRIGE